MLLERGVYCGKWVGINISDALYRTAEENHPWAADYSWHEAASTINGKEEVNNLKSNRQDRRDRNKNNRIETDVNTLTKEDTDRAPNKTIFDNTNNTANLYMTYTNQDNRNAGTTNDNFDQKFVMFQNRRNQIKLKGEDRPEAISVMLAGSAIIFYNDDLYGKSLYLEMTSFLKCRLETP